MGGEEDWVSLMLDMSASKAENSRRRARGKVLCGFVTHLHHRPRQSLAQFRVALQLLLLVSQ